MPTHIIDHIITGYLLTLASALICYAFAEWMTSDR